MSWCDLHTARLYAPPGPDMTEHLSHSCVVSSLLALLGHILNFEASLISLFREIQKRPPARKWWGFVLFFSNMHTHTNMRQGLSPSLGGEFAKHPSQTGRDPQSFWFPVLCLLPGPLETPLGAESWLFQDGSKGRARMKPFTFLTLQSFQITFVSQSLENISPCFTS